MNIELQKLFLNSPFDVNDFSEDELKKIEQNKVINIPKQDKQSIKLNIKHVVINQKR